MRAPRLTPSPRSHLVAPLAGRRLAGATLLSAALVVACGGPAAPVSAVDAAAGAACTDAATCEAAIVRAVRAGDAAAPLVEAAAARLGEGAPLTRALAAARAAAKGPRAIVVAIGGATAPRSELSPLALDADVAAADGAAETWVAIGEAAGLDYVAVARPDGTTLRVFPRDPLAPLFAGIVPALVDPGSVDVDADRALEAKLRAMLTAAAAFDYVVASDLEAELDALVAARPRYDGARLRAELGARALSLATTTSSHEAAAAPEPAPPAPAAHETAYLHLARIRTDPESARAFDARKQGLLAGLPADRHEAATAVYGDATGGGCAVAVAPAFDRPGDLAFASLLPTLLLPARARGASGRLPLEAWYPRHEAAVALAERSQSFPLFASTLLMERGGSSGVVPSGSATHRKVDGLAKRHLGALTTLARARPGRLGLSVMPLFLSPGLLGDEAMRKAMADLAQVSAQASLAEAKNAEELLIATLTGGFSVLSLPGDVREAYISSLQAAFTAKLRGELVKESGWATAGAFAVDALYRVMTDQGPQIPESARQIARALESDPAIPQPGLASLTAALVGYGALGHQKTLGAPILEAADSPLPDRAAARASLERALARLAPGETPDPKALAALTRFVDGLAATAATAIAAPETKAAEACSTKVAAYRPDPRTARALAKLRDQRRALLAAAALGDPSKVWTKRARLVALIASDAIDLAERGFAWPEGGKEGAPLFVSDGDAGATLRAALETFVEGDVAGLGASGYQLARGFASRGNAYLEKEGATAARVSLTALGRLLDDGSGQVAGAALLATLGQRLGTASGSDLTPALLGAARALAKEGRGDQRDLVLLGVAIAQSVRNETLPTEALALAVEQKSDVAWVLALLDATGRIRRGQSADVAAHLPGLEAAMKEQCAVASARELSALMGAARAHQDGRLDEARAAIDAFLSRTEKTLVVPRATFHFKQETVTRVVDLKLEVGLASPFVDNANGFNVGGGFRSSGEPRLSIGTTFDAPDLKRTLDDTAKLWVRAQALAAIWHYEAGDLEKADLATGRLVGALTRRTWLTVQNVTDPPSAWLDGARGTLIVLGELASERGRPQTAGVLFGLVRASFDPAAYDPATAGAMFEPLPVGLEGARLAPYLARATKTAARLGAGLPCFGPAKPDAALERASCQGYPEALALRASEAYPVMPRLAPGKRGEASACPEMAALDAFLQGASTGTYDPDRFQEAVNRMIEAKKPLEAAYLLVGHRAPAHCSPALVGTARRLTTALEGVPTLRADLTSLAINCESATVSDALLADLRTLEAEVARVGDPQRSLEVAWFAAGLTLQLDDPRPLAAMVSSPDFAGRWRGEGPTALGVALVLDHTGQLLQGKPVDAARTAPLVDLLCGTAPATDRVGTCTTLASLRQPGAIDQSRKATAKKALEALFQK